MRLLPLEEALTPVGIALLLAIGLPALMVPLLRRIVGEEDALRGATLGASAGIAACLGLAGHGAIGPSFAPTPMSGLPFTLAVVLLGLTLMVRGLRPLPWRGPVPTGPLVVGLLIGLIPAGVVVGVERITAIEDREVMRVEESDAWWRMRVDPWDANALLALGWAAERREEGSGLAAERCARAEALGARTSEVRTLEAALRAADGDCDEARRLFDQALTTRAEEALERNETLELDYPLPEVLVRHCELEGPSLDL